MIGIRSAISIRARGHRPHLEAVYMTAPRSVCRNTKKALPRGGRPYMTRERVITRRMRGIQYAAASRLITSVAGILDHPLSRVMTAVVNPRSAARMAARFLGKFAQPADPRRSGGARRHTSLEISASVR